MSFMKKIGTRSRPIGHRVGQPGMLRAGASPGEVAEAP
jgi:hypothetical protein